MTNYDDFVLCENCQWSEGAVKGKIACQWLYRNAVTLPPFLGLYEKNSVTIGTEGCYPKWVDNETAKECSCFQLKFL